MQSAGKYRQQGRNYIVEDGDIIFFKFNAGAGLTAKKKWDIGDWSSQLCILLPNISYNKYSICGVYTVLPTFTKSSIVTLTLL